MGNISMWIKKMALQSPFQWIESYLMKTLIYYMSGFEKTFRQLIN